jgi:dihydroorotate dehydrogenase subfamily 2
MLYKHLLKPILFKLDPEDVHDLFIWFGELLGKFSITRRLTDLVYGYHKSANGKDISVTVDDITYRTPVILSAGFDYNARLTNILPHVGFGGEEIGSVTARPCAGNPKPRLKRLPKSGSIVVNKGLRNDGVDVIIKRIKNKRTTNSLIINRKSSFVLGISIARTNDAQSTESIQASINDYLYSFKRLNAEGVGDFYTINISCPNAFGGETFSKPELLEQLLSALKTIPCSKPVYVKMPINISWDEFDKLLQIINKHGLQGVVIGNLNKDYTLLDDKSETPSEYMGGLSGKTCRKLSTDLIRKTRETYGKRFTIMGVGGIMSPEDTKEKFDAGADLVQLISGMIFEGPGLMKEIGKSLE